MNGIKAIETRYQDYRFRSRLEARWAVFFDNLGVEYRYEPEGFEIDGARYLPDFYLPQFHAWVEVKAEEPTTDEMMLLSKLALRQKLFGVMLAGHIGPDVKQTFLLPDGNFERCDEMPMSFGRCFLCGHVGMWGRSGTGGGWRFLCLVMDCLRKARSKIPEGRDMTPVLAPTYRAYAAARSARFEFGEQG